jgi:integrase
MTPLLRQLLQEWIRGKAPDDFVLTRKDGRPVGDFRGSWETVTTKAGVPDLPFHDRRRTAVRNMIRAGIPERLAMQISGRKTRSIFDRYRFVVGGPLDSDRLTVAWLKHTPASNNTLMHTRRSCLLALIEAIFAPVMFSSRHHFS